MTEDTAQRDGRHVARRKLYEGVESLILEDIRSGRFKEGDRLPSERDLMNEFRVGRPAIREALFSLSKKGLVAIRTGERPRVTKPTPSTVFGELSDMVHHWMDTADGEKHLQDARLLVEIALARFAATNSKPEDIVRMRAALEANKSAIGDRAEYERSDVQFHYAIARVTANPIFAALNETMLEWLTHQRSSALAEPNFEKSSYLAHKKILAAIEARDPDAAEKEITAHLRAVKRAFWKSQKDSSGA